MPNNPRISVIVPAYNEEKALDRSLDSLTHQTYRNFELIVVDNNSKDRTGEIARNYTPNVILETQPGYIHAVRAGAAKATGELITFCDADTFYPSDWLEKVVEVFDRIPQAVAVYGSCVTHDSSRFGNWLNGVLYTNFLWLSRFLGLDNTSGFNFVMRRDAYELVGGYDPKFKKMSPDIELGKRLKKVGPVLYWPSIVVEASFRRYQDGGALQTQWMFFKAWWAMLRGQEPMDYTAYNQEIR